MKPLLDYIMISECNYKYKNEFEYEYENEYEYEYEYKKCFGVSG